MEKLCLQEQLEKVVEDDLNVSFLNNYSGRGMYGKSCIALSGSLGDCMAAVGALLNNMHDEAFEHARDAETDEELNVASALNIAACNATEELMKIKWDNMGYDVVVYWPDLPSIDSEEELSDREDEAWNESLGHGE